jgi:acetate kinase
MNSLVLIPGKGGLRYAQVAVSPAEGSHPGPRHPGRLRGTTASVGDLAAVLAEGRHRPPIDVLTIRARFGGPDFPSPMIVDADNQARFRQLGAQAPLDVSNTNTLIDDARATFPDIPIAVAFETSFFVALPARETTYALPGEAFPSVRRWGYHGLHHDAATAELARFLGNRQARMLSICLDPHPELAAVLGRIPRFVTGGSTQADGLPGERNCGEIDPAIVLDLAADPSLGPERANQLLTRESGFFGMLGYPATLGEVLTAKRARIARVREHLLYQLALAAGASLAALEGLDGVVFSGPYARHGDRVAARLLPQIERTLGLAAGSLPWRICPTPLENILAEAGVSALLANQSRRGKGPN